MVRGSGGHRREETGRFEGRGYMLEHVVERGLGARQHSARVCPTPHRAHQVDLVSEHIPHAAVALAQQHIEGTQHGYGGRLDGEAVPG